MGRDNHNRAILLIGFKIDFMILLNHNKWSSNFSSPFGSIKRENVFRFFNVSYPSILLLCTFHDIQNVHTHAVYIQNYMEQIILIMVIIIIHMIIFTTHLTINMKIFKIHFTKQKHICWKRIMLCFVKNSYLVLLISECYTYLFNVFLKCTFDLKLTFWMFPKTFDAADMINAHQLMSHTS